MSVKCHICTGATSRSASSARIPHAVGETAPARSRPSTTLCGVRCEARARRTPCRPVAAGRLVECPHPRGRTASVVQHVEPTDLTLWATVRHVYPLWRAQWRLVTVGLACALVFTGLSLLIPIIVQRTIDDAIDGGDSSLLVPYLTAIAVVATLRFGVNFTRRFAAARIGIRVEARLRSMLYAAYLTYPRAFYDRHATGEVISRATNDIYPVRYFVGWGVIQAIQSVLMLVGAAIVLTVSTRSSPSPRRSRCRRSPSSPSSSRTGSSRSRARCSARKATSRRRRTRRSSGSRWCRRSAARTTCGTGSASGPTPCATRRCDRRRSRLASSPGSSSCRRSASPRCSSSAGARRSPATSRSASSRSS